MRVLIVGCGYVGLPLAAELVCQGHEVSGLRRDVSAAKELRAAGVNPLFADINRPDELARLPAAYDWVVNCVAAGGGSSEDYRRTYVAGTRNLLDWLQAVPPRKFVYTSSTGVYGQDDGSLVTENEPTAPASEAGRILVETENLLLKAAEEGFPAVILRLAGIYGPDRGYWMRQFLSGDARLEGGGDRFLNMIHRDDAVGAAIAALERARAGEVFNVVDDESATQLAVFQWLSRRLGKALPAGFSAESGGQRRRRATNKRVSNRKLKESLGYRLRHPTFREGFEVELRRLGV